MKFIFLGLYIIPINNGTKKKEWNVLKLTRLVLF